MLRIEHAISLCNCLRRMALQLFPPGGVRCIAMSMSVCMSVCLSVCPLSSRENYTPNVAKFLRLLPISSWLVAIRYVLVDDVIFSHNGHMAHQCVLLIDGRIRKA